MHTDIDPALGPIHPGEVLLEEFLDPMGITQYRLAKATGVDPRRINGIVHGKRAITADTALRLGLFFGIEPQMWLNLQARYDLEVATQVHGREIEEEVTPWKATGT
jgi:antitoxin HigA-1